MAIYSKFNSLWSIENGNAYVGKIFIGDEVKFPKDVFHPVDTDYFLDILSKINGFWGAVITKGDSFAWIISDRIRSYPVFYAQKGMDLFISSDAHWVREQSSIVEINKEAEQEFLLTEQITGDDTLFVGLKQLQAGEILIFNLSASEKKWQIKSERYYRYLSKETHNYDKEKFLNLLDEAMLTSFQRLCTFANGRTIVIPLSGGYDSRLIALFLKRLDYKKIVAYSYGIKGNEEAKISKEVADTLNIPWIFIEYTDKKLNELFYSNKMKEYSKYSGNYSSLPHTQDWYAVKSLKENNMIPVDAVFVPGHSSEVPAGSQSSKYPNLYSNASSLEDGISALSDFIYTLSRTKRNKNIMFKYEKKLKNIAGNMGQYVDAVSLFDSIDIAERQAKFITNSVRVYESFGYDWWTPYWDIDFLNFWSEVPKEYRFKNKLYYNYIITQSKDQGLFPGKELKRNGMDKFSRSFSLIIKEKIKYIISALIVDYNLNKQKKKNYLARFINNEDYKYAKKRGAISVNGMYTILYIRDIYKEL